MSGVNRVSDWSEYRSSESENLPLFLFFLPSHFSPPSLFPSLLRFHPPLFSLSVLYFFSSRFSISFSLKRTKKYQDKKRKRNLRSLSSHSLVHPNLLSFHTMKMMIPPSLYPLSFLLPYIYILSFPSLSSFLSYNLSFISFALKREKKRRKKQAGKNIRDTLVREKREREREERGNREWGKEE